MTPPRKPTTHSDAGPSSPRSAIPNKPTYADALRSNTLLGTNFQFRLRTERLHASLRVPHFQFPRKPKPAVQKVFNTPELLAEILTYFPLESDRRLMGVCKAFWECLNPGTERHLYGIKQALGIKFSHSIASITEAESETIWNEEVPPELIHVRRVDWLFNVGLECPCAVGHHTPLLTIEPFALIFVAGQRPDSDLFNISLKLDAESLIKEPRVMHPELKGVKNVRNGQEVLYSNQRGVSRNWMDVKLLNMPFRVRVSVTVDFRKGMGAPTHHEGHCPVQGCQLGLWGQQRTETILDPERATVGEFIAFLDLVESDSRLIAECIARRSVRFGPGQHGEPHYLGVPAKRPPRLQEQYEGEFVARADFSSSYSTSSSPYILTNEAIQQMRPRTLRDFMPYF